MLMVDIRVISQRHGMDFIEGWDWTKIWWVVCGGFLVPSVLFGLLWGVLRKDIDIQGAFWGGELVDDARIRRYLIMDCL